MIRSLLVAKSGLDQVQLADRKNKGFNKVEIQLLPGDVIDSNTKYISFIEERVSIGVRLIRESGLEVVGVHTMLESGCDLIKSAVRLEYCQHQDVDHRLYLACKLASQVAKYQESKVYVVVHVSRSLAELELDGTKDILVRKFKRLAEDFPGVVFAFENAVAVDCNGVLFNGVTISEIAGLVSHFKANDIPCFALYDSCHAQMNDIIYGQFNGTGFEKYMSQLQDKNKLTTNNLRVAGAFHLSALRDAGVLPENHGSCIERYSQNFEQLKEWISLVKKSGRDDVHLVIEVKEDNYLDAVNLVKSADTLEYIWNRIGD